MSVDLLFVLVVAREREFVAELFLVATEKALAGDGHVASESELLAIQNKGVFIVIHLVLVESAVVVEQVALGSEVFEISVQLLGLSTRLSESAGYKVALRDNLSTKIINVGPHENDSLLESLKSNHELGLSLHSSFVFLLIEDVVTFFEVVHLLVEVSAGKMTIIAVG